jgi:hypothetical protein
MNDNNDVSEEIKRRIQNANKCYYRLKEQFRSWVLTRENKIKIYVTLVRHMVVKR